MKFITPKQNEIIVFTDGSSRGNPGKGGYGSVCIYPDSHGVTHVEEPSVNTIISFCFGASQIPHSRMMRTMLIEELLELTIIRVFCFEITQGIVRALVVTN
jgi:hypothetical protein